jgi:hypothetical protein
VTKCSDCGSDNREDAKFCNACGARIESEIAEAEPQLEPVLLEDDGPAPVTEDEGSLEVMPTEDAAVPDSTGESESATELTETEGEPAEDVAEPDSTDEPDAGIDVTETEGEGPVESMDAEVELGAEDELPAEPKAGYLVFPDNTVQPIPPSQWLIGRTDLAKFLTNPDKANEISRGHLTVFQEGERFFVEDGPTMVQRKPSANKTWLVRGGSRTLVTGTGRTELQDADQIDVAELVKLQFVVK